MHIDYSKQIEIRAETDVFIAGGGPAGAIAAIAAAREGAHVFLAEAGTCFGGLGTTGMVPAFMEIGDGVNPLGAGLGKELMDLAFCLSGREHAYRAIDKEALKRAYDALVTQAGVEFRFMTRVIDVKAEKGRIEYVVLSSLSGLYAVKAKTYLDCTGDGTLCVLAGAGYEQGDENGVSMPATLCSQWTGIDWPAVRTQDMSDAAKRERIKRAYADGVLSVCDLHLPGVWKTGHQTGGGNVGHAYFVDAGDEVSVGKAMIEQRKRLVEYEKFYRTYVKGYENAEMISTAEMLGIRASRRIRGEYVLTVEDYLHRAVFDDEICRCAYAIDIHPHKNDESSYDKFWSDYTVRYKFKPGESYGIPYRCLIPESCKNFLVAGRCISTDHYVQASVRIMPACFVMGQAAGTAAALSAQSQMDVADIPVARLQKRLIDRGVCLPNYKEQSAQ